MVGTSALVASDVSGNVTVTAMQRLKCLESVLIQSSGLEMLNTQFSPWPSFTEEEANAARDVIVSNKVNYWTGQECRQLLRQVF